MILIETLRDLCRLLDRRGRILAGGLVVLLIVSGSLEMGGLLLLFGYISALSESMGEGRFSAIAAFYPMIVGNLKGTEFALAAGVVLIAIFALKNFTELLTSFYLMRFAMKRYERIATRLFGGFLHVRLEVFYQRGTMQPQQVLQSVIQVFRTSFNPALETLSDIAIVTTILIALMLLIDPLVVLGAGLFLGTGAAAFLSLTRRMSKELGVRRLRAEMRQRQTTMEGFGGLIDARLAGRLETILARYGRVTGEFALSDRRARAIDMMPRMLNEMLLAVGIVLAAVYFGRSEGGLQAAIPVLAVMGFAGLRITAAMSRVSNALQRMHEDEQNRQMMMDAIRRTAPELFEGGAATRSDEDYLSEDQPLPAGSSGRFADQLTLEAVSFTYPGAKLPAIQEVSLTIPRGAFVSFCGPSGGGKSTLALLIMGLIRPQSGKVLCDGWNIFHHLRAWHANIGYVGQSPFILPRNVRENVAFGYEPEEIDDAQVWRALEMAALAEVIRARPRGLDAGLGENGALLSGGQRQRLIIARALYRDPEVLVFDEATAALDNATEKEVTAAISALSGTKTVICIAHRLTTIESSDVVHFMQDGQITASGSYAELEAKSEAFQRMARCESNGVIPNLEIRETSGSTS